MKEELTQEERDLIPVVRDKWIERGTNPKPLDVGKAVEGMRWIYEFSNFQQPVVYVADSPAHAVWMINLLMNNDLDALKGEPNSFTDAEIAELVPKIAAVITRIRVRRKQFDENLMDSVDEICRNYRSAQRFSMEEMSDYPVDRILNLYNFICELIKRYNEKPPELYKPSYYGDMSDYSWVAYADYYQQINAFEYDWTDFNKFKEYLESNIYQTFCFDTHVFLVPMPKYFISDAQKRLHCEDGPVAEWEDGWKAYYIENMGFMRDFVMSKPEDIDIELVLKEENTEKRRIMIKKIGYDRILTSDKVETAVIEEKTLLQLYKIYPVGNYYQQGDILFYPDSGIEKVKFEITDENLDRLAGIRYQLIDMLIKGQNRRPFLVMNDFTTGERYVEGVPPGTDKVYDAIKWRNKTEYLPKAFS